MKYDIPTCQDPVEPHSMYMRVFYRTFFFGPLPDEDAGVDAIRRLDVNEPDWDDDGFSIFFGANPLPSDYVCGFKQIDSDALKRILSRRNKIATRI